jgi:hypothetical protein
MQRLSEFDDRMSLRLLVLWLSLATVAGNALGHIGVHRHIQTCSDLLLAFRRCRDVAVVLPCKRRRMRSMRG